MDSPKQKFALKISPEILRMVEKNYKEDGCGCRSAFIEKAILFYCGYLTANDYRHCVKGCLPQIHRPVAQCRYRNADTCFGTSLLRFLPGSLLHRGAEYGAHTGTDSFVVIRVCAALQ